MKREKIFVLLKDKTTPDREIAGYPYKIFEKEWKRQQFEVSYPKELPTWYCLQLLKGKKANPWLNNGIKKEKE